jgi:hypothetical protein
MNITGMINKFGCSVHISGADGYHSTPFRAFIQPLRYKTKLYLQGEHTPIGVNRNDVYLYIVPANHDLTKLDSTYRIHDKENNKYMIDRAEKIMVQDTIVYVWAVIRKTTEGDL